MKITFTNGSVLESIESSSSLRGNSSKNIYPIQESIEDEIYDDNITYRIQDDKGYYYDTENFKRANEVFENWKIDYMGNGVDSDSYIELRSSVDDFEEYEAIKKVIAVVDEERMKISTPKDEGIDDWEYWAMWEEV